jgi:hypothetical protein
MRASEASNPNKNILRTSSANISYFRLLVVMLLAVLLLSLGASAVHANTLNAIEIFQPSPTPNSVVDIRVNDTITQAGVLDTFYIVVQAPDGSDYFFNGSAIKFENAGPLTTSASASCTIPFGQIGDFSGGSAGPAEAYNCFGSDFHAWQLLSNNPSIQDFQNDCPGIPNISVTTAGLGSTAQTGTYGVYVCLSTQGSGQSQTGSFAVNSPIGVPEFSLGLGLILMIVAPLLVLLKRYHVVPTV